MAVLMMCVLFICTSVLFFTAYADAMPPKPSASSPANAYFVSVAPEKRDLLIKHYLTEALESVNVPVIPDPRIPSDQVVEVFGAAPPFDWANGLLAWTRSETGLSYFAISLLINNDGVNTDEQSCYPGDMGCNCCPY